MPKSKRQPLPQARNSHRTEIILGLFALVGVVVTAVLKNWDKIKPEENHRGNVIVPKTDSSTGKTYNDSQKSQAKNNHEAKSRTLNNRQTSNNKPIVVIEKKVYFLRAEISFLTKGDNKEGGEVFIELKRNDKIDYTIPLGESNFEDPSVKPFQHSFEKGINANEPFKLTLVLRDAVERNISWKGNVTVKLFKSDNTVETHYLEFSLDTTNKHTHSDYKDLARQS